MDLGHGMIQNPAAEVAEVVEYLIACEKTLASLYTLADCLISWQARSREVVDLLPPVRHRSNDVAVTHDRDMKMFPPYTAHVGAASDMFILNVPFRHAGRCFLWITPAPSLGFRPNHCA